MVFTSNFAFFGELKFQKQLLRVFAQNLRIQHALKRLE